MVRLNRAAEVLLDPARRLDYDRHLAASAKPTHGADTTTDPSDDWAARYPDAEHLDEWLASKLRDLAAATGGAAKDIRGTSYRINRDGPFIFEGDSDSAAVLSGAGGFIGLGYAFYLGFSFPSIMLSVFMVLGASVGTVLHWALKQLLGPAKSGSDND